jgi:hypothetical protein
MFFRSLGLYRQFVCSPAIDEVKDRKYVYGVMVATLPAKSIEQHINI